MAPCQPNRCKAKKEKGSTQEYRRATRRMWGLMTEEEQTHAASTKSKILKLVIWEEAPKYTCLLKHLIRPIVPELYSVCVHLWRLQERIPQHLFSSNRKRSSTSPQQAYRAISEPSTKFAAGVPIVRILITSPSERANGTHETEPHR